MMLLGHKQMYGESNLKLQKFTQLHKMHPYPTKAARNKKIFIHRYRTSSFGHSTISAKITKIWNILPTPISCITNYKTFKTKAWEYCIQNPTTYNQNTETVKIQPIKKHSTAITKTKKKTWTKSQKDKLEKAIIDMFQSAEEKEKDENKK
eukprot:Lithocolla_globosa_v1_NODE_205_length_5183_cov_23.943448.p4 type:complete len:150 gc:universal NODE_205_length_5183_cov_23.943448:516-67(-)